ncbi:MAG: type IV secretion protein IcmK, partial [Legionella sp.]
MIKINKIIKKTFITAFAVLTGLSAHAQDDNAQQALQQLRLLQQRLSKNPGTDGQEATDTTANNAATTNQNNQAPASQNTNTSVTVSQDNDANDDPSNTGAVTESDNEVIKNKAFKDMTESLYPLTPEQVVRLKQTYQTSEYAQASTPGTPPKPTATSQFVNLSPGSTPPVIRLSQGFVSSLVFLDSTGAPWPIAAYDLGDPSAFNIQWDKTGNTLMIQAQKLYNYGNLAVRLKGLNTPVMLTLIPGQKAVDYRVDLRVQGYGPNAKTTPLGEGIPPEASDLLLHVLDGVPPPGSQRLIVSGGDARAWLSNDKMYVRTNLTILSPGWLASMTSADGTHAYEMQKSPVILVSWHGKVMQLKVEG